MKLIITFTTVITLFCASMAESRALYLCSLCAGDCASFNKPAEKPVSQSACQSCCSEKEYSCAPGEKSIIPAKPVKPDNIINFCCVAVECGKLNNQCCSTIEPPELISTIGERNTIANDQDLELGVVDSFGEVTENRSPALLPSLHKKIHPTISTTILRC